MARGRQSLASSASTTTASSSSAARISASQGASSAGSRRARKMAYRSSGTAGHTDYRCEIPGCEHETFKTISELNSHFNRTKGPHNIPERVCEFCEEHFFDQANCRRHMRVACKSAPTERYEDFKCQYCDFTDRRSDNFKRHYSMKHPGEVFIKPERRVAKAVTAARASTSAPVSGAAPSAGPVATFEWPHQEFDEYNHTLWDYQPAHMASYMPASSVEVTPEFQTRLLGSNTPPSNGLETTSITLGNTSALQYPEPDLNGFQVDNDFEAQWKSLNPLVQYMQQQEQKEAEWQQPLLEQRDLSREALYPISQYLDPHLLLADSHLEPAISGFYSS